METPHGRHACGVPRADVSIEDGVDHEHAHRDEADEFDLGVDSDGRLLKWDPAPRVDSRPKMPKLSPTTSKFSSVMMDAIVMELIQGTTHRRLF